MKRNKTKLFETLGNNIKIRREELNMSLEELSEKTNIRKEYLKKIETGNAKRINITQAGSIANALQTRLSKLFA